MSVKRQLFLSWMAVRAALLEGKVQEADLKDCLFSTSLGELILGQCLDRRVFNLIFPRLLEASAEGRLVFYNKIEQINGNSTAQLNDLLRRNGLSPLTGVSESNPASLAASVDRQDIEFHFVGQPGPEEMRVLAQRQREADDAALVGRQVLEAPFADWMQKIRLAVLPKD